MKKLLTIIFDGFGIREDEYGNAIKAAKMKNFQKLWDDYPHTTLKASEEAVGLNSGQVGNSEVGHSTIGAGRVLKQNELLVNEFLTNIDINDEKVKKLMECKEKDIHLMGLCSDGNVHAGVDDFVNMYKFLVNEGFSKIHFHLITDGRDTGIHSAYKYIKIIEDLIKKNKIGDITTVCGRYYAMDRDENWDRTKIYYNLVVKGKGISSLNIEKSLENSYQNGITDEFIKPIILTKNVVKNGDVIIWMNYRADRSKQILKALTDVNFSEFELTDLSEIKLFTLFNVDKKIKSINFIDPVIVKKPLGIYLSDLGFTQARIAESEKFPHVTYFFDGGYEGKIEKCDKFHIPSPEVATYDLKPEMSAVNVTKKVINCMENDYDFILVNYANPDMVGHTGNLEAAVKAIEVIDECVGKVVKEIEKQEGIMLITADHGNAEQMIDYKTGEPHTAHTTNPVPLILVGMDRKLKIGKLADLAPTILEIMGLEKPEEMTGNSLLV